MYCSARSFDKKVYIWDTYKHISRNEMPCQAVFNKISLDPIQDELRHLKKIEKILIFKRIIFKKIGIMHEKWNLEKLRVAFVISSLKQQIYVTFCHNPQIQTD